MHVHTAPEEMQEKVFLAPGKALWETSEAPKKSPSLFHTANWETQIPTSTPGDGWRFYLITASEGADPTTGASVRLGT